MGVARSKRKSGAGNLRTCQCTVPEAIRMFHGGRGFRGRDPHCDQHRRGFRDVTAVTWNIAEARWGMLEEIRRDVEKRMDDKLFVNYQRIVPRVAD